MLEVNGYLRISTSTFLGRNFSVYVDLLGARSTIDTLALLEQKTRGNLTETENKLLQHSLYELHLAFVEVTNALTRPPDAPAAAPPRGGK